MSTYTSNLNLFKYDTETDGKQVFNFDVALNNNWDALDDYAETVNSSLSTIEEELDEKLEATVSLATNGYIKFSNSCLINWGVYSTSSGTIAAKEGVFITYTFACSYTSTNIGFSIHTNGQNFTNSIYSVSKTQFISYNVNKNTGSSSSFSMEYFISCGY